MRGRPVTDPVTRFWARTTREGEHVIFHGKQFRVGRDQASQRLQPIAFAWLLLGGRLRRGYDIVHTCSRFDCVAHIKQVRRGQRIDLVNQRDHFRRVRAKLTAAQVALVRSLRIPLGPRPSVLYDLARQWRVSVRSLLTLRTPTSRASRWREVQP